MPEKGIFISRTLAIVLVVCVALAITIVGLTVGLTTRKDCDVIEATSEPTTVTATTVPSASTTLPSQTTEEVTGEPTSTEEGTTPEWEPWHDALLPTIIRPSEYSIYLYPNMETDEYEGEVVIRMNVNEATKHVILHQQDIEITRTKLFDENGAEVPIDSSFAYDVNQYWVIVASNELQPGIYDLELDYNGDLTKNIVGIYKSVYTTSSGEKRSLVASKFQPTYARQAFPNFDEPNFKAAFNITLVHPGDPYYARSNMPAQETHVSTEHPGMFETVFEPSVKMSSYLVEFIVCDFDFVENDTQSNIPMRIYSTADQIERTEYALRVAIENLDYFEEYYKMPYPLPKLDHFAIPDYVSGATEHWGIITYRETNLLYDDLESSSSNKQRICQVIAHETAHMWFGNLVTNDWWNDIWLQEGFASYVEYLGMHVSEPNWEMEAQFIVLDLLPVMDVDATVTSRPIIVEVNHPDEITSVFDVISYNKGASIIRMLDTIIGTDQFTDGLKIYLERFQFENSVTDDLWEALEEASGVDVKYIMDTWTLQMGFPVIEISRELGNGKGTAKQVRFLSNPDADTDEEEYESPYNYTWYVPLDYITSENSEPTKIYMDREKERTFDWPNGDWVKFNSKFIGYYRVNYPEEEWQKFTKQFEDDHNQLNPSDRSHLISDAFSLAEAGLISFDIPLNLTRYLEKEENFIAWDTAYKYIQSISSRMYYTNNFDEFRRYVANLVKEIYDNLGFEVSDDDTHLERKLRVDILTLACGHGLPACIDEAKVKFREWIEDSGTYIHPDLRSLTYKYGMMTIGGADEWDVMWARYLDEQNASEKSKLMYGLAKTQVPWLLHRYLDLGWDTDNVRTQDYWTFLGYISDNPVGRPIVWDYYRANWENFVERYTLNDRTFGRYIQRLTETFNTEFQLNEMIAFFEKYPDAGAGTTPRKQSLDAVEANIAWVETNYPKVLQWLENNVHDN